MDKNKKFVIIKKNYEIVDITYGIRTYWLLSPYFMYIEVFQNKVTVKS